MKRAASALGWAYSIGLVVFVLLPVLIMVPASFGGTETLEFPPHSLSTRWYEQVLGDRRWLDSAALSLKLACGAALIATLVGLLVGIAHLRLGRVSPALRALLMLPMVAPHIVLATGLFSILLQMQALGSPVVLALGLACLAMPITVVVFISAIDTIDPLLWTAAASLGARWWTIMRQIILPNMVVALVAALLLAFVSAWDEVTFSVFIGPLRTPTLPARMFAYLQELINPSVTAIATLLMAVTLLAGGISLAVTRRRSQT